MKTRMMPWLIMVGTLALISGCSEDAAQIEEATSTDKPVIGSQVANDELMPPKMNHQSAMEVKDKQLMDDQPEKPALTPSSDIPLEESVEESVQNAAIELAAEADKQADAQAEASPEVAEEPTPNASESSMEGMETETASSEAALMAAGEQLYATCVGCHGATGEGGVGPKLAGLSEANLVQSLKDFKAGKTKGPMSAMMIPNAQQLSEEDILAVSKYIAGF